MINATEYLNMDENERTAFCREVWTQELAQRVMDVDFYGAMDADETPATIAETIKNDPLTIIDYLLNVIDEYQA